MRPPPRTGVVVSPTVYTKNGLSLRPARGRARTPHFWALYDLRLFSNLRVFRAPSFSIPTSSTMYVLFVSVTYSQPILACTNLYPRNFDRQGTRNGTRAQS